MGNKMRLTKKKAIDISIELWIWLAETGSEFKSRWEGWDKYEEMFCYCALCEYAFRHGDCNDCPYYKKFGECCEDTHPYHQWENAESIEERRKYAELFLEQLRQLK